MCSQLVIEASVFLRETLDARANDFRQSRSFSCHIYAAIVGELEVYFAAKGDKQAAQVFATAVAIYVTNQSLADGTNAAAYGFTLSGDGIGVATVNVGSDGAAVGKANNTTMTVMDILVAVAGHASRTDGGFALYIGEQPLRSQALDLFGKINDA
jgi:hypothetical protein